MKHGYNMPTKRTNMLVRPPPQNHCLDRYITAFDNALRAVHGVCHARRPYPATDAQDGELTPAERRHSAALLRVDHVGEICAQALYHGQAFVGADESLRRHLLQAAADEADHLDWCRQRLDELGGRVSYLSPLWYIAAFTMGVAAGTTGKTRNLGFVAETESQVESHLRGHLDELPPGDRRSRAVLLQMKDDESRHGNDALDAGGKPPPPPVKIAMRLAAKVMTTVAYRL